MPTYNRTFASVHLDLYLRLLRMWWLQQGLIKMLCIGAYRIHVQDPYTFRSDTVKKSYCMDTCHVPLCQHTECSSCANAAKRMLPIIVLAGKSTGKYGYNNMQQITWSLVAYSHCYRIHIGNATVTMFTYVKTQ